MAVAPRLLPICAALLVASVCAYAQTVPAPRPPRRPVASAPVRPVDVILGRPSTSSITLNVLATAPTTALVAYGPTPGKLTSQTSPTTIAGDTPTEIVLANLTANTRYCYQLRDPASFKPLAEGSFHTARPPGSTFTFELQGDSHPERPQMFDPILYSQTLRAAAADRPDFYFTLGDDFSIDTLRALTADSIRNVYLNQRRFLSQVAAPVFLVNGNHEQAALANLDGTPNSPAVLAQNARNTFFPQPAPDAFYTADTKKVDRIGLLRDYYAFTWGDALFAVIDPYWHSPKPVDNVLGQRDKGARDLWNSTLGDEQYAWLKKTLETSAAKHKFVFAHHVLGTGRGGIEQANLFEWGGQNKRGRNEFADRRPTWPLPIHQLFVKTGVTIFFQGHDHLFARQTLDGVTYQTLPLPADPNYALLNKDAYLTGDILPGSGRLRVTVSPDKVRVEYLHSHLPKDATGQHPDGEVAFTYVLPEALTAPGPATRIHPRANP